MKGTIYNDGIEVDQSDLRNTEDTKADEILLSRLVLGHYGVIEGLALTIVANTVQVGIGKAMFPNGEIGEVTAPIPGAVGASFDPSIASFVGLRLVEVKSNQKPHEVDPVSELTRLRMEAEVEFFVATDATDAGRNAALANAIGAEVNDRNFVLLGEILGTGTGITLRRGTQLPRTKGGDQPHNITVKTAEAKAGLQSLYNPADGDQFPVESSSDEFHRSLIGSGPPTPNNPHGMTLSDIGGDKQLGDHETQLHTNGVIGLEPTGGDFAPDSGSFAFSVTGGFSPVVTVQGLVAGELLIIRGTHFDSGAIGSTAISFAAKAAGLYYIIAKFGSDTALTIDAIAKATLDAKAVSSGGQLQWLNNAVELSGVSGLLEPKFYVIGLVSWDGASTFLNLTGTITIPAASGALVYSTAFPASHPLFIQANKNRLDLRRYGTISNVNTQRRTIHSSRIVPPVTEEAFFRLHSGMAPDGTAVAGQGQRANSSNGANGDDTTLKHLSDRDAWLLFGHRSAHGIPNHAAAIADLANNAAFAGFQTAQDKWKQDNLTMTILKWSDLKTLDTDLAERAIGDANATSTGGAAGVQYAFGRSGFITNVFSRLGVKVGAGNQLRVNIRINDTNTQVALFVSSDPDGTIKPFTGVIPFTASPAAPIRISCTRDLLNANGNPKNLSVTAEYHYFS